jgi:hypothetical protein
MQYQAMLNSHFVKNKLLKVSKTGGSLVKTHIIVFWVKILTQRSALTVLREINRAKTWMGANVAEHFLTLRPAV